MYIQVVREIDLCAEGVCPADLEIVDIHYRLDDMSLCVALSNGDLVSWLSDGKVSMIQAVLYCVNHIARRKLLFFASLLAMCGTR